VTNLLSIDPGYAKSGKGCACAFFRDGAMHEHWFERPENWTVSKAYAYALQIHTVLWEKPQCDGRTYAVGHATMIELTAAGASLAGLYAGAFGAQLVALTPSASKGSVPKPVCHRRLWQDKLTADERLLLGGDATWRQIDLACEKGALARWKPGVSYYPGTWLTHNILDAVALGCGYLGR
jgi:hypothetical protein